MQTYSLFVYGSLLEPALRRRLLAREVAAEVASLTGYRAYFLKNQDYPALRQVAGAVTTGLLIQGLSGDEMRRLDDYEGELYTRRKLKVCHGYSSSWVWVYLLRSGRRRLLSRRVYRFE